MKSELETEVKLAVADAESGKRLLTRAGFEVHAGRVFERNLVLDDDVQTLRSAEKLLRVRKVGDSATCTYKGPPKPGNHKQREEQEFQTADFGATLRVFQGLGYRERFRYEKYRTEFVRRGEEGTATLDETPIGCYIELEGEPDWIDRTAKELGYSPRDYIKASYGTLYFEKCHAEGKAPSNMVFPQASSAQSSAYL